MLLKSKRKSEASKGRFLERKLEASIFLEKIRSIKIALYPSPRAHKSSEAKKNQGKCEIRNWPLTKEIRLKVCDPIISNSFPVRYYGISGTNLPDIP